VHQAGGGRLGFNAKFIVEMGEEIGSPDLRQVREALRNELTADLFPASGGPRLAADRPTIFPGCRGGLPLHPDLDLREGSHHSGNWGGLLAIPATILSGAIAPLVDGQGRPLLWTKDAYFNELVLGHPCRQASIIWGQCGIYVGFIRQATHSVRRLVGGA
jgi:acetylornithine deacetylase/succinyl-diaminopimelate desuccinylase-like protein